MSKTLSAEEEIERFRQVVIASRNSPTAESQAAACLDRLNKLFTQDKGQFTEEDVRYVNVMRGVLGVRLAAHAGPSGPHARKAKRKGDTLDHCWRCQTPVDERFGDICPDCSQPKGYQWRVCPVCQACGCQRGEKKLV